VAVDRDKVLQAAQKLVEKKRYDKAVVEYQKLVADDPKDVRTLLKIGDLFLKMEQHVDAITTYERVGQFYSAQGFALKAIAVYKQIREIIHKHVPHMEDRFGYIVPKLAEIYTQLNLTSDALATYDEVATRLQRAGRDRDAIDIFKKIVDLDPQNPLPYLRLAEAFVRVRDVDNAITRFGTAAEILLKLGRRDDALKVVERLLQHRADPRFARTAAEIYLERAQPADAMAALTKLQISFKDNPKDLETLALLARAFDKLGQPTKAIEVQKESARIAKEAGKTDQFVALVASLAVRAPNDEGVRALMAQRAALSSAAPAPTPAPAPASVAAPASTGPITVDPRSSIDIEVDEEMVIDEDEPVASEAPFALRPSYGGVALPVAPPSRPSAPVDPAQRLRQVIAQAEGFRRNKDYDQAIAVLVEAIDEIPGSRELRERLCDTLIEAGEQDEAIRQMLGFARWLGGEGDVEGAAQLLDEILLLEPEQAEAIGLLRELGYAVGPESYAEAPAPSIPAAAAPTSAAYPGAGGSGGGYDPNAPLPSYDLEEISAVEVLSHRPGPPSHAPRGFTASQLDDPFGTDAPLPSFDIEEAPAFMALPSMIPAPPPSLSPPAPTPSIPAPPPSIPPYAARISEPPAQLDEEALEEVEFFASHGMFDEARALLDEQLARLPNNRLLLERKREIEAQATGDGSGTRAVPRPSAPPQNGGEDRSFDIAASLDALDALDAGPPPQVYAQPDSEQVSVESVFEQFKAGVAAQISESDAATHYDLGVAYKEMGLYTDAISEFELASRDPGRECVCQSMVGMIYLQLGNVDAGIDAFIRGLHASVKTREQELALTYEIGDSYEARRATDQALYYFQRVARIDPGYADMRGSVSDRIRRLEPVRPMPAPRIAVANGETLGDEFDAALDDLLDDKLP
jgi:tetratricopeptide (TPR) repeat protein